MIKWISNVIPDWLIKNRTIHSEDKALYAYAVYSLVFGMLPITLAVVYGAIMNMITNSVVMIVPFMFIRKFSGGFHLKSPKTCFLASSGIIVVSLILIRLVIRIKNLGPVSTAVAVSTVIIVLFSPIDSCERKLSKTEIKVFGTIARLLTTLFAVVYFLLVSRKNVQVAASIGIGITIPALLQIPCILKNRLATI